MKTRNLLLPLILILATLPLQAAMYKWTDANGQVHYAESPPPGVSAKRIDYHYKPATPTSSRPVTRRQINARKKQQQGKKQARKQQNKAVDKQLAAACDQASATLAQLGSGRRVRVWEKNGSFRYLTDAERQKRLSEATIFLSRYCKKK